MWFLWYIYIYIYIYKRIIDDVLIKVDKFNFSVNFILLDTKPVQNVGIQIPMILM
jgi:hypothetical protein